MPRQQVNLMTELLKITYDNRERESEGQAKEMSEKVWNLWYSS